MPEAESGAREQFADWKAPDAEPTKPDYRADPLETPFSAAADESERHARYRMTAYLSLERVRAITEEDDGLEDETTRNHLAMLRDELNHLELD